MQSILKAAAAGLVLATVSAGAARAEQATVFGYTLNVAIRGWMTPTYDGSKRIGPGPGGSLAVTRPSEFDSFAASDDAASFSVYSDKHIQTGIAASVREPRDNNRELTGMRSIGWSLHGGGYFNYWATPYLRFHVEALKGLTSQYGVQVNTGADVVHRGERWRLSIGPRLTFGDADFNNRYFGVTRTEAILSPYIAAPYTAKAGLHFTGVEASAEYKWRPQWRQTFYARYKRLLGDDANSPLVKQLGNPNQFAVSTGVRFMFPN